MKKLLLLTLLLTACEPQLDTERLDATVQENLRTGPWIDTAFLTLKYGDTRPVVARKLARLRDAGTLEAIQADRDGWATGYHFTTPYELKALKWNLSTSFHNDSLTGVSLSLFKHADPTIEYQALRNKYFEVYGGPAAAIPTQAVFVNGSQRVDLTRTEEIITVTYQNTALERRISKTLTKAHFDEFGNSYDSAYYKQVVVPRESVKPANPDGI
jgi:hypothetical protein